MSSNSWLLLCPLVDEEEVPADDDKVPAEEANVMAVFVEALSLRLPMQISLLCC